MERKWREEAFGYIPSKSGTVEQLKVQTHISKLRITPYIYPKVKYKKKKTVSCDMTNLPSQVIFSKPATKSIPCEELITPRFRYNPSIQPIVHQRIRSELLSDYLNSFN